MKKFLFLFCLMFLVPGTLRADLYHLVTQDSKIEWVARKVTGQHNGVIQVKSGTVKLDGKKISGGEFEIDMNSIRVLDIKDEKSNAKLTNHLKSDDFFSVAQHPTAKFVITKVEAKGDNQAEITGNLTIKGITHPITIPATLTHQGDQVSAKGEVTLDRTKWDVRYGSGKFFKGLGDKLIYDEFDLKLDLVAKQ